MIGVDDHVAADCNCALKRIERKDRHVVLGARKQPADMGGGALDDNRSQRVDDIPSGDGLSRCVLCELLWRRTRDDTETCPPLRERHPGRDEICRRDGPHNPWSPTPQQGQRGNFSSDCWSRSAVSLRPSLSRSTIRSGSPASLRPDSTVFGIPGAVQASQAGGMDGGTRSSILGNRNSNGPDSG